MVASGNRTRSSVVDVVTELRERMKPKVMKSMLGGSLYVIKR